MARPALRAAGLGGLLATFLLSFSLPAAAVPSFARQTGLECTTCHVSWPELTAFGRQFKLGGYTLIKPSTDEGRPLVSFARDGNPPVLPAAAFVQASVSRTANKSSPDATPDIFPKDNELVLQQASLFLAGRVAEHLGGFVQWSYDGIAHHSAIDNVDIRASNRYASEGIDLQYGLSLNNSPTMSDLYNTTPVWGFPFAGSAVAPTPAAATLIQEGLAQQVAGLTAFSMWNRTLYAELGAYRTADGVFSVLRAGVDRSEAAVLDGTAPYWRLALQHDWGAGQSAMVGAYGLDARKFPDPLNPVGASDRFRDLAFDAQYQYLGSRHRVSAQITRITETQSLDASFAAGGASNRRDRLDVLASKLTYYLDGTYGATLGYQRVSGDADAGLYGATDPVTGSANASPDSSALILELNWLPWRDRRFTLQYTAYGKFNGARSNYDGHGRNASDNNTLFLLAWLMF